MPRIGITELPLHGGEAPAWLFNRMVKLSAGISEVIIKEYGAAELVKRMADPFWFQALSCVLGFDWHSSGTTTVTCGAIKSALRSHPDIGVAGGKGLISRQVPEEISRFAVAHGLSPEKERRLKYCSRMSAKVDSSVLQDGHRLYHHFMIFDMQGNWSVIQQGMNEASGFARRYQWSSEKLENFVVEPHSAVIGKRMGYVLDMTAKESETTRSCSVDLVKEDLRKLERQVILVNKEQSTLLEWAGEKPIKLYMPKNLNWTALKRAYDFQPRNYEELISLTGVGPSTVRALALISQLIYGTGASWKDPVKFSFAFGGKDGVPYPVDKLAMDLSLELIKSGIEESHISSSEKLDAIKRLKNVIPPDN
ncbi:MAG: DUF763 domain-containing protein [Methanomassiliicoccales archaeon]